MIISRGYEKRYVIGLFIVYLIFQVHAVEYHGYWGQDFVAHKVFFKLASERPWEYFNHYTKGRTNPPLYHLIGGMIRRYAGTQLYLPVIGLMNALFGLAGLCFTYAIIRRLIDSSVLRLAAITLIAFLPFAMIHAEVIASDALSTPLFFFLVWLMIRFKPDVPAARFIWAAAFIAFFVLVAVLTKFMFGSFIMATGVWALALWWTRQIRGSRLAVLLILITVLPALRAYRESVHYRTEGGYTYNLEVPRTLSEAAMNPRSIFWLRDADLDMLSAPAYNWKLNGDYNLLVSNKHSLPALLQLSIFTDILNIYQYDPYDFYFGQRGKLNHQRMQIAVRIGIVFSLLVLIGVIVLLFKSTAGVVFRREAENLPIFILLLFSTAWFVNIVAPLPFIPGAYFEGYWTPRLTAPALIGFFIVGFAFVNRLPWKSPKLHLAILGLALAQSAVHASFLWPYASSQRLYDSNFDVPLAAYSSGAVFRVLTWQDSYNPNMNGAYWLGETLGIVVNRPDIATNIENWRLSFKVENGPSNPGTHGVLKISSRNSAPQLFEFNVTANIQAELQLSPGRNDIRVEFVSPKPVETPQDLGIEMASISDIKIIGSDGTKAVRIQP